MYKIHKRITHAGVSAQRSFCDVLHADLHSYLHGPNVDDLRAAVIRTGRSQIRLCLFTSFRIRRNSDRL